MPEPIYLPRADQAEVPLSKLRDYALNPAHEEGGLDKARVFRSALGLGQEHAGDLASQIVLSVHRHPVSRIDYSSPWGVKYEVVIPINGPKASTVPVVTGWIIDHEPPDARPRLTTAYVFVP